MLDKRDNSGTRGTPAPAVVAALEHLTGVMRGTISWIIADEVVVNLIGNRRLEIVAVTAEAEDRTHETGGIARIHHIDGHYVLDSLVGFPIWVNGALVEHQELSHGDVIEFGDEGPLTRLRLFTEGAHARVDLGHILTDVAAYLRRSRKPIPVRLARAGGTLIRRLVLETTFFFRVSVLIALLALALFGYQQERGRHQLEQQIATGAARLEGFAVALKRAHRESLRPADLQTLRTEVQGRLATLERRSEAVPRMIAESRSAIAFLQGGYGYRETATGRMLRHVVDAEGNRLMNFRGQPLLTLEGEGPVAERQFTGTGFFVGAEGVLVTNRHVALPWEDDATAGSMAAQGLEPVPLKFIAYFPGVAQPRPVSLLRASEKVDLALLALGEGPKLAGVTGLRLAETAPNQGDEVIVLGYPTGLRALVAQTGEAFIDKLQEEENLDFWEVAGKLSSAGYIVPAASRGIVGRVTAAAIVYDAETTHGGSGGPVLNGEGEVVAINMAILPEYGGSNLGLPVAELVALMSGKATN